MNKDLMMKAVVQSKGVWLDEGAYLAVSTKFNVISGEGVIISVARSFNFSRVWEILCTREEFEDFVDSLFEGAPDDATHRGVDGLFYKLGATSAYFLNCGTNDWRQDANGKYWQSKNLIPRPVKKAKPEAPYMPKVGEECEVVPHNNVWGFESVEPDTGYVVAYNDDYFWWNSTNGFTTISRISKVDFRPLRTERELFIEQATTSYLEQVGSDAVNEKWFGRIFGALFDKGARFDKN